jgi:putative thioredoxin
MFSSYTQGAPKLAPTPAAGEPAKAGGVIKDTTTQGFRQDVIAESMTQPVLVDFWAPWCGPCKQLTPVIEKVVTAAGGKVKLVKMNIDDHPQIAGQLGIQSIPAVIAFSKGQPVDGFMGAVPESQIKQFIEKLVGPVGPGAAEEMLMAAEAATEAGDIDAAAEVYAMVLAQEPTNLKAIAGMAKLRLDLEDLKGAKQVLALAPPDKTADPLLAGLKAAIDLAEQAAALGDVAGLVNAVEANPKDHQSRFDLALALNGRGQRDDAADHLIAIIRADRAWNDDGARKQLVQFFEAWGPMDEASIAGRRKLSAVLFS